MAPVDTERNLLFGLLALQVGLIDRGALFAAFATWTRDKGRPLTHRLDRSPSAQLNGLSGNCA